MQESTFISIHMRFMRTFRNNTVFNAAQVGWSYTHMDMCVQGVFDIWGSNKRLNAFGNTAAGEKLK